MYSSIATSVSITSVKNILALENYFSPISVMCMSTLGNTCILIGRLKQYVVPSIHQYCFIEPLHMNMYNLKENLSPILNTLGVCFLVYIWGLLEFSFLWVVIFTIGFMLRERDKLNRKIDRENARMLLEEGEEAYLKVFMLLKFFEKNKIFLQSRFDLPAWVTFPSVERAEWINTFLAELWPNLERIASSTLQEQVEPMLLDILADYHISGFRYHSNIPKLYYFVIILLYFKDLTELNWVNFHQGLKVSKFTMLIKIL